MSVSELYPSKGSTLNAADLKGKEHKLKISEMDIAKFDNGNKLVLKFEGKEKGLALNKTNAMKIADAYGDDETAWIGKEILIYPDKTDFQGKMVDCIRVRLPLESAEPDDDIPF